MIDNQVDSSEAGIRGVCRNLNLEATTMDTKARHRHLKVLTPIALLLITLFGWQTLGARSTLAAQQDQPFDITASIQDNLEMYVGERVEVRLVSGGDLAGTVVAVGKDVVHLSSLSGREFFDALVRLDQVGALVVRARDN